LFFVSAGHCIQEKGDNNMKNPEESFFIVGKHNLSSKHEKGSKIHTIEKFILHKDWKPHRQNFDADIGLAVLNVPLTFQYNVKPICLGPAREDNLDLIGKSGVIVGWGFLGESNLQTGYPTMVTVPIIDENSCLSESPLLMHILTHRMFCTSGKSVFYW
jgi:hypothetical protein